MASKLLSNLVSYSSSSESEIEETDSSLKLSVNGKNNADSDDEPKSKRLCRVSSGSIKTPSRSLPLPSSILTMFGNDGDDDHHDNPEDHGGRQRSFAHQRGNWPSFVYAEIPQNARLQELVDSLLCCLRPTALFTQADDLHVTLSPTVSLKHHWIDPFVGSLKKSLTICSRSQCHMSRVKFYTNDEKTRTFLGLTIDVGEDDLQEYVEEIDKSLTEFKLATYYKDPSFHVSVAWCVGDVTPQLNDSLIAKLQCLLSEFTSTYPSLAVVDVKQLICKTGNKLYVLPLS